MTLLEQLLVSNIDLRDKAASGRYFIWQTNSFSCEQTFWYSEILKRVCLVIYKMALVRAI